MRKILAFERQTVKITSYFSDYNALFLCFMAFPAHIHAQILLAGYFACEMKIPFKKSDHIVQMYQIDTTTWLYTT